MEIAKRFDVIGTGTGRCGTKFVGKLLTSVGIPCGHETFFTPQGLGYAYQLVAGNHWPGLRAESSWQAAPYLQDALLREALVIHLVRHPQGFIESVLKIWPEGGHTAWTRFAQVIVPSLQQYEDDRPTWLAHRYAKWNEMIEAHLRCRDDGRHVRFNIEHGPRELLEMLDQHGVIDLQAVDMAAVYDNRKCNTQIEENTYHVTLDDIKDGGVRDEMLEVAARYGYEWRDETRSVPVASREPPVIKAVVTTLDNLPNLQETVAVLRGEPLTEVIVVDNGSEDGTAEWLAGQDDVTAIVRENRGAGPGRNAGLDVAGQFDFVLMLDGGIRPLWGGTARMLDYLRRTPEADVIGVEIADFETDYEKAWRRWPDPVEKAYQNTRLSHTAYALCRARAWDGLRFCEEGPFGEPGWGADDDEMAYRWNEAGIAVHVVTCACKHGKDCSGVHPYRRASGSFRRLFRETGIWPDQYGSVYEKRLVWLQQNWPQYQPGLQWGEPWLTVVVRADGWKLTANIVKRAHDELRKRTFKKPYQKYPNPYSVVVWGEGADEETLAWAETRRLRQHQGSCTVADGKIVKRGPENEAHWTGDFRMWTGEDWRGAIRPNAYYFGLVSNHTELTRLLKAYNEAHPPKLSHTEVPEGKGEL